MNKHTHLTLHSHPSLFPLQMALIAAERATPARPPLPACDANELLVLQLIQKIKHPAPQTVFTDMQIESPLPSAREVFLEMAESHV